MSDADSLKPARPAEPSGQERAPGRDGVSDKGRAGLMRRLARAFSRNKNHAIPGMEESDLNDGQREALARLPRARRDMIERVIAFDEKRVDDVMAPRADIVAVDFDLDLNALIRAFDEAGHSRLPIYRGDLDDPVGMVHIKDVVGLIAENGSRPPTDEKILKSLRRDVLYVPPSMRITDLLLKMQASRIHMALVIDEFGGTDGLVTIEDLVEQIVGDINDEHDDEDELTIRAHGRGWDVDARVELDEFAEETGVRLDAVEDEVDTLGGLVFSIAGRVPQRGEVIAHPSGYEFEVTEADPRAIRKIRIRLAADRLASERRANEKKRAAQDAADRSAGAGETSHGQTAHPDAQPADKPHAGPSAKPSAPSSHSQSSHSQSSLSHSSLSPSSPQSSAHGEPGHDGSDTDQSRSQKAAG